MLPVLNSNEINLFFKIFTWVHFQVNFYFFVTKVVSNSEHVGLAAHSVR